MNIKDLPQKIASLDIDTQNSFTPLCPEELPIPGGDEIVEALNQQAQLAQFRIGTKDAHPSHPHWAANATHPPLSLLNDSKHADTYWPLHCVTGTKGFELVQGLPHPSEYDYFVWKGIEPDMHPYGACYHDLHETLSTGLIEFLTYHQVQTIIVGGLATEYCVKQTVLQLLKANFNVILNLKACRGLDPVSIQQALKQMHELGAILIQSSSEIKPH